MHSQNLRCGILMHTPMTASKAGLDSYFFVTDLDPSTPKNSSSSCLLNNVWETTTSSASVCDGVFHTDDSSLALLLPSEDDEEMEARDAVCSVSSADAGLRDSSPSTSLLLSSFLDVPDLFCLSDGALCPSPRQSSLSFPSSGEKDFPMLEEEVHRRTEVDESGSSFWDFDFNRFFSCSDNGGSSEEESEEMKRTRGTCSARAGSAAQASSSAVVRIERSGRSARDGEETKEEDGGRERREKLASQASVELPTKRMREDDATSRLSPSKYPQLPPSVPPSHSSVAMPASRPSSLSFSASAQLTVSASSSYSAFSSASTAAVSHVLQNPPCSSGPSSAAFSFSGSFQDPYSNCRRAVSPHAPVVLSSPTTTATATTLCSTPSSFRPPARFPSGRARVPPLHLRTCSSSLPRPFISMYDSQSYEIPNDIADWWDLTRGRSGRRAADGHRGAMPAYYYRIPLCRWKLDKLLLAALLGLSLRLSITNDVVCDVATLASLISPDSSTVLPLLSSQRRVRSVGSFKTYLALLAVDALVSSRGRRAGPPGPPPTSSSSSSFSFSCSTVGEERGQARYTNRSIVDGAAEALAAGRLTAGIDSSSESNGRGGGTPEDERASARVVSASARRHCSEAQTTASKDTQSPSLAASSRSQPRPTAIHWKTVHCDVVFIRRKYIRSFSQTSQRPSSTAGHHGTASKPGQLGLPSPSERRADRVSPATAALSDPRHCSPFTSPPNRIRRLPPRQSPTSSAVQKKLPCKTGADAVCISETVKKFVIAKAGAYLRTDGRVLSSSS